MIRVAINGFGRIGRNFLRAVLLDEAVSQLIDVCAINCGPADIKRAMHLFKYDSLLGTYPHEIRVSDSSIIIGEKKIVFLRECDPSKLPWNNHDIDWVVESSGCFTDRPGAQKHIDAGAKKVLITAPARDEDITVIPGVNDDLLDVNNHTIVSLGSCTTNAVVPMLKVVDDAVGIESCCVTSIHAYTNTQALLDADVSSDVRRCRAAAYNIIPTTTGAAELVSRVLPGLAGKVSAVSVRVPVAKVSLVDMVIHVSEAVSPDVLHESFVSSSQSRMKGIVSVTMDELVSADYQGNNYSVVVDAPLTRIKGHQVQLFGWYDNEWGYSVRLKDFLLKTVNNS